MMRSATRMIFIQKISCQSRFHALPNRKFLTTSIGKNGDNISNNTNTNVLSTLFFLCFQRKQKIYSVGIQERNRKYLLYVYRKRVFLMLNFLIKNIPKCREKKGSFLKADTADKNFRCDVWAPVGIKRIRLFASLPLNRKLRYTSLLRV